MLDDLSRLKQVDAHGVADVLAAFGQQCRHAVALRATPVIAVARRPHLVIVAAMGGSAASGDLLSAVSADLDVPVVVHRDYGLPAAASGHALVIASSYSGETVEVLSAAETAVTRGLSTVVVTTGGPLGDFATRERLPRVTLAPGLMPRMALGSLFFPLLHVVSEAGLPIVRDADIAEALEIVDALARELAPECPTAENAAKQLARAIGDRLPAVYGGPMTGAIAYRWKTDFAENAKRFALAGTLPEMNHNEIEAWQGPAARRLHAVFLRDRDEASSIARRFAVLRELIAPAAGGVTEVWTRGAGRLARLLSLICVGQWTSYYLAVQQGRDPWPIPLLDALKRRLRP